MSNNSHESPQKIIAEPKRTIGSANNSQRDTGKAYTNLNTFFKLQRQRLEYRWIDKKDFQVPPQELRVFSEAIYGFHIKDSQM